MTIQSLISIQNFIRLSLSISQLSYFPYILYYKNILLHTNINSQVYAIQILFTRSNSKQIFLQNYHWRIFHSIKIQWCFFVNRIKSTFDLENSVGKMGRAASFVRLLSVEELPIRQRVQKVASTQLLIDCNCSTVLSKIGRCQ